MLTSSSGVEMNLDISLFELSLPPLVQAWRQLRGQVKMHHAESYMKVLTKLVIESNERQSLFVSIGTGDFLAPWLTRLYTEQSASGKNKTPRISKLVIKRLSFSLVTQLEAIGAL